MTGRPHTVRAATMSDQGPLSVLLRASYGWMLLDRYNADTVAGVLPELATPDTGLINSRQYYVATDEQGNLIGAGGWSWGNPVTGDLEHGKAHIRQFATHPTNFGKGVASAILARVRQDAAAVKTLECRSTVSAQGFFARHGFKPCGEVLQRIAPHILMATIRMTRERTAH